MPIVRSEQSQLEDVLGACEVFQLAGPEVDEHDIISQRVDDEFGGRTRTHDLAALRQRPQSGGAVDRASEVVTVAELGLTGMQCHANSHGVLQYPGLAGDRLLHLDGRGGGGRRPVEDREGGVTLAASLDQPPAP